MNFGAAKGQAAMLMMGEEGGWTACATRLSVILALPKSDWLTKETKDTVNILEVPRISSKIVLYAAIEILKLLHNCDAISIIFHLPTNPLPLLLLHTIYLPPKTSPNSVLASKYGFTPSLTFVLCSNAYATPTSPSSLHLLPAKLIPNGTFGAVAFRVPL
jgi:hypothetical protein